MHLWIGTEFPDRVSSAGLRLPVQNGSGFFRGPLFTMDILAQDNLNDITG